MGLAYLALVLTSFLVSLCGTWYIRRLSIAHGWVSQPTSPRHVHTVAVPRSGGIAVFGATVVTVLIFVVAIKLFHFRPDLDLRVLSYILGASVLVFLVGLLDDIHSIRPIIKVIFQSAAATILFCGGMRVVRLGLFRAHHFGWIIGLGLTILWVLWITNAFNLIDGLDGLAAGSALFSTLAVFAVSLVYKNDLPAIITVILAGAILGFLRFNFNPATIFLGDSGSLFIGFMLSALAMAGVTQKASTLVSVAIPVVSFGLPILETAISVARRFLSGRPVFRADGEHIHHRLLKRGFSHRKVVVLLYGVSALCGMLSLFLVYPSGSTIAIVLFVFGLGVWVTMQRLGYHEFVELRRVAIRGIEQKQVIVNNLALRRATESLAHSTDLEHLYRRLVEGFSDNEFDGFELRFQPPYSGTTGLAPDTAFTWDKSGELRCSWPSCNTARGLTDGWNLKLQLRTTQGRNCGEFIVYRSYKRGPLLIDVNLLIRDFSMVLADALDRGASASHVQQIEIISSALAAQESAGW